MNRNLILIFVLLCFGRGYSQSIEVPFSTSPIVDGVIDTAEWAKADSVTIEISRSKATKIFYLHDSVNLYVAFVNNLQSGGNYFPELLFDTGYDTAVNFQSDDWWFHVSATDCEYQGQYGNYANCSLIRPNWEGVPNFAVGSIVDTVEVKIPLNTIGVKITDTIGVGFLLNNFSSFKRYPAGLDHLSPKTFMPATFEAPYVLSLNENELFAQLKVYPVPNSGIFQLLLKSYAHHLSELRITNLLGKQIYAEQLRTRAGIIEKEIDISTYPKGVYILTISSDSYRISRKIVVH